MQGSSDSMDSYISTAIQVLRILSPFYVFLTTASLIFTKPAPPPSPSPVVSVVVATRIPRRTNILLFLSLVSLTYLADGLTQVLYAIFDKTEISPAVELNTVVGLAAFSGLAALGAWKDVHGVQVWFLRRVYAAIAIALTCDTALVISLGLSFRKVTQSSRLPIHLLLQVAFPTLRVLLLLPLLVSLSTPRTVYNPVVLDEEESVPTSSSFLLPPDIGSNPTGLLSGTNASSSKYGTFRPGRSTLQQSTPTTRAPTPSPSTNAKSTENQDAAQDPSWTEQWRRLKRISPYIWPSKSPSLQLVALICILILLLGRAVNAVMPSALSELVRIFEHRSDRSPWLVLGGYVLLRFLQSSGGLSALRDFLWAPVMQYSDQEMSLMSFNHLLNLSFSFHTRRKTGEVLRVLDRGAAINHTLELILFNIVPTFVDICVALVILCIQFDWTLALMLFVIMFAYVVASIILTQRRTRIRRQMNEKDVITRGIHTDCLLNYETVKYFGGEEHEAERYRQAISDYQGLEYRVIISLNLLNLVQNFIITLGLLIGSIIVARHIIQNDLGSSDFVFFITYLAQLYTPLNQLGYIYRSVNQSLVDTEKLLALLNEPTDVNDKPNAPELYVVDGEIEFDNVTFSYDGRTPALGGVSFKVPKNSSVALVGESGSGKSTILRLLYRFYDLKEGQGRILIDGQDIRDVTQKSLRQAIGVVPQDSVLFNTTISYNIGYGKFNASPDEIEAAAKSAQMHDRIMTFPKGYDTVVGERGVRLSGGEKQRVAIARTLLKNPPILLLDEATSALDTSTERDIQKALQNLMVGRSSLSIAHRLSTIVNSELILVLKNGQIVEQGSLKELLALDGIFAAMWADQVSSSDKGSIDAAEVKQEVSGYTIDDDVIPADNVAPPQVTGEESEEAATAPAEDVAKNEVTSDVALSAESQGDKNDTVGSPGPLLFPSGEETEGSPAPTSTTAVAFPLSDETPQPPSAIPSGVTFDATATPPRTGTPDPDAEPKRKRISSQNFQRLARRISISTKRQGSISSLIPGLKRNESSPRASIDDGTTGNNDSAASSVIGDGKSKKDKKRKS